MCSDNFSINEFIMKLKKDLQKGFFILNKKQNPVPPFTFFFPFILLPRHYLHHKSVHSTERVYCSLNI